jgi:hypothetical protein
LHCVASVSLLSYAEDQDWAAMMSLFLPRNLEVSVQSVQDSKITREEASVIVSDCQSKAAFRSIAGTSDAGSDVGIASMAMEMSTLPRASRLRRERRAGLAAGQRLVSWFCMYE